MKLSAELYQGIWNFRLLSKINLGSFIDYVDRNLDFLTPSPPLWTILLNKAYVVIWTFGNPPLPPAMSTWFMNVPF